MYFAIAGLVLGAAIVGLPYALAGVVRSQLTERLHERGVDAKWQRFEWQWPTSFGLRGAHFATDDGRVRGSAERVDIRLPWDVVLDDHPHADAVEVRGAKLTVDVAAASNADTHGAAHAHHGHTNALWRRLAQVGEVRGDDIAVALTRGAEPLGKLALNHVVLSGPGADGRAIRADGSATVQYKKLGHLPVSTLAWSATGRLDPDHKRVELTVAAPDAGDVLVDLAAPRLGSVNLHDLEVRARLGSTRSVEVAFHKLVARLGAGGEPAVELEVPELSVSRTTGASPKVIAHKPRLSVAPKRLADLRRTLSGATQTSGRTADANTHHRSLARRLVDLVHRIDASVDGGRFDLRLHKPKGTRQITLVDGLQATLADGQIWAKGTSAGGEFGLSARLDPGMLLPRALAVHASNVRLDDLPGIKEGRTLPNRGLRGRVGGVVDASLMLSTEGQPLLHPSANARVNVAAAVRWKGGHVELSGLADQPLDHIDAGVDFDVEWTPALAKIALLDAHATYGPITVDMAGEADDWPFDPVFDLRGDVDEIECQQAVHALPKALLGAYADIEIDGKVAPKFRVHLPWNDPRKLSIHLDGFVDQCHVTALNADKDAWPQITFAKGNSPQDNSPQANSPQANSPQRSQRAQRNKKPIPVGPAKAPSQKTSVPSVPSVVNLFSDPDNETTRDSWPVPDKLRGETYELPEPPKDHDPKKLDDVFWLNRPFIKQVTEGVSDDAKVFVGPGTDGYVPIDELPPFVAGAAYLSEEMEFYEDHGVDLGLIQKALRLDFDGERFVYGGSTVTQQLVKNLFLTRDKTLSRKLREALIAWRIEDAVPKWRVLELYLNCIEYAQDVYGIGAAAKYYFGKDARDLTPTEAVFLAILKPAPWYGDRFRRHGHTPTKHWWFDRMGEIMGRLVDKGYLTPEQAEAAKPYVIYWDKDGHYLPDGADDSNAANAP